jgi:hypothetical protein
MKLEKGIKSNKELPIETKDLGDRRVLFTISKEVVDRDGDILRANGCDLTNYLKNKVFLGFHNSRDFPLGKTEDIWIEADRVKAIVYFPTVEELSSDPNNASEKAKLCDFCYHCYKTGMLNAVSVGFIPLEWTETKDGYDITKWELLEFSAVAVPANQDAIAEAVKSFGLDESVVKDFLTTEKSGRKISAQTREILNKIKACGDKLEECQNSLKACGDELRKALAELDDDDDKPEEGEKPEAEQEEPTDDSDDESDDKSLDFDDLGNEVELP